MTQTREQAVGTNDQRAPILWLERIPSLNPDSASLYPSYFGQVTQAVSIIRVLVIKLDDMHKALSISTQHIINVVNIQ